MYTFYYHNVFFAARMHYISKNHLKNQKKWLTQQSEIGFNRAREVMRQFVNVMFP